MTTSAVDQAVAAIQEDKDALEGQHQDHRELTVADRCDTCGAQAFVLVVAFGQDLQYCNHHFRKYETNIRKVAEYVSDQSDKINVKASASSPD